MPPCAFFCAYYNNRGFRNAKNKETKKNKLNQINKAHILGLSSYICCVLIYLKANDKSIDVYIPLLNLNGMIKK